MEHTTTTETNGAEMDRCEYCGSEEMDLAYTSDGCVLLCDTHRAAYEAEAYPTQEPTEGNEMTAAQTAAETYQAQTVRVSYEDMANPRRVGTVVEHRSGEFRIAWDDEEGGETWTDLRQYGWRLEG